MSVIAYVGPWSFPHGGAGARRILGNALSLRSAGYEVRLGCGDVPVNGHAREREYAGFPVEDLGERTVEMLPSALKRLWYAGMGRKTVEWLDGLETRPTAVILYSGYSPYLIRLLSWCKGNNVPLIFDAVEWYDPPNFLRGLVSPYHWNIELAMRFLVPRAGNVIAISSYLENYYRRQAGNVVRVPPTLDTEALPSSLESGDGDRISLAYTGTPGNKDLLDNCLEAMLRLDPDGRHFRFKVAGIPHSHMLAYPALRRRGIANLPDWMEVHGRLPHNEAMDLVRNSDFSLLLRKPQRFTEAGFPTKAVESMAVGTPLIANITSDLGRYIYDGEQGIICATHEVDSLMEALNRVLSLPGSQYIEMRRAARRQAEASFDFRHYAEPLRALVENAVNRTAVSEST